MRQRALRTAACLCACLILAALLSPATSAAAAPAPLAGLKWRSIGPSRGSRVLAVAGVVQQPEVFYFGAVVGGVWKTYLPR